MRVRHLLLAATVLAAGPALAGPTEDFRNLQDNYWAAALKDSPTLATSVGVSTYDRQLDLLSTAEMDRVTAEAAGFLTRLKAIPAASLPTSEQTNYAILKDNLERSIEANGFGQRMIRYSILGSYHGYLAGLADIQSFRSYADYDNYLARFGQVPDRM